MSDKIILFPGEAEKIVETLKPMLPDKVGLQEWCRQQEYIDKLNVQAVLSASNQSDEYIKEFLITYQKIDILVECLVCLESWRENVLTRLLQENEVPSQTFGLYGLLYGEASIVTLLETVLYHGDSVGALERGVLDLVDYCHRGVAGLLAQWVDEDYRREVHAVGLEHSSPTAEVRHHMIVLSHQTALRCISILHYLIDHLALLPLSVSTRLFSTFDVPLLLVEVVHRAPWAVEEADGKVYKYVNNKWLPQDGWHEVRASLSGLQGQVWLSLFQLLLSPECRDKYDLTSSTRRSALLSLRAHLSDVLVDQLPVLASLRRFLEELSLMSPDSSNIRPNLVLEQVAEFRDAIDREFGPRWEGVYAAFLAYLRSQECADDLARQARAWTDTYGAEGAEMLMAGAPRCPVCGREAAKRCSRCKQEWYCRRECQVQHWPRHKKMCDLFVETEGK